MYQRHRTGRAAEDLAARFLRQRGMKILVRNWHGGGGELDIVARQGRSLLVVVEVRSKASRNTGEPEQSLGPGKRRKISRATSSLLVKKRLTNVPLRMDLLAVDFIKMEIRHYPGGLMSF